MHRKIHTDQRPNVNQDTLVSLIKMKFNSRYNCYDSTFPEELLSNYKKATSFVV